MRVLPSLALLGASLATACASNPALRTEPTGQRLAVAIDERPVTVVEREELLDVGATDGKGGFLGVNVGRDVERDRVVRTVQLKQGLRVVDEQDFYEIARDSAAFRQVSEHRSAGRWLQAGGVATGALGAAVLAGGTGIMAVGFAQPGFDAQMGLVLGGFFGGIMTGAVAAVGGYAMFAAGGERLEPDQLLLPVERAQAAAEAYNAELDGTTPPAVATR